MHLFRVRRCAPARGFTLIEILVVIGMIGILAGAVLVAVNPLKQFAQARNAKRVSDVSAILNAISNRIADNNGVFMSGSCQHSLPPAAMEINDNGGDDLRPCLVPDYIPEMPVDPATGNNGCTTDSCAGHSYSTGYTVALTDSHRVTVCAPQTAIDGMSTAYCLTR